MYEWIYKQLCWATWEEACAPPGQIAWYKKIARRWLPTPKRLRDPQAQGRR